MQKHPVVYFHTHWDREWYEPFRSYQVRLAEVVDEILARVEAGVLPCFTLDGQTVLLDDYLELRPQNRHRLKHLVENAQLSVGPWFVMPDEFLVGGESLLRNLKLGIVQSRQWGCHQFTGYLPDTFGHSADMPMLLHQFGIEHAMLWRGVSPTHHEFTWQSPSGHKILGYHLSDGYFQMMLHCADWDPDLGEGGQSGALHRLADKLSGPSTTDHYLMPMGGDHLGPLDQSAVAVLKQTLPDVTVNTPERFLMDLAGRLNGQRQQLQTMIGELTDNTGAFLLPGVYSARVYLKQANRKLEHALLRQWEPLTVLSRQFQLPLYPQELETAWRLLMLNHPHDSICGCSVDAVHRENEVRFDQVSELAQSVMARQQVHLSAQLAGPDQWLLINMSDQPFTGVVPAYSDQQKRGLDQVASTQTVLMDAYRVDHQQVPLSHKTVQRHFGWIWADDIPPLGYRVMKQKKAGDSAFIPVSVTQDSLENEFYTLHINSDGTLSVLDKATGKIFKHLHQWRDLPQQGDSYNAAPVPGQSAATAHLKRIKVTHKGPLVGQLAVSLQLDKPKLALTTTVRLEAGNPLVTFETQFTNTAPDHQLQVGFPTGRPIHEVLAESHFSVVKRTYNPDFQVADHMPTAPWTEIKPNTGPIQRFIAANGQALITEGIAEYEVFQDLLYLTLFRGFGMLSKGDTGVRGAQAGPPLPTPEGQCLNRPLTLRYAWCPEKPPADLFHLSNRFYGALTAVQGLAAQTAQKPADTSYSLLRWENPNLVLSACLLNADNRLILRLLNLSDQPQQSRLSPDFQYHACCEVNALDEPLGEQTADISNLTFQPFALRGWMFTLK